MLYAHTDYPHTHRLSTHTHRFSMHTHRLCIAPMMEWTDRHYRYLVRLMTKRARLYTEMIACGALIHGDRKRLLAYNACEHPVALQLGGSDPLEMAQSARWGAQAGYDEININAGCPSDRVQAGGFGVCLMREPGRVAACISAIQDKTDIPVTVKCRIGIDHEDSYGFLAEFIDTVQAAGCDTFIIHARKACLQGLNPRQNRQIPALNYARVYQLKNNYPELNIIINGGIQTLAQINSHLNQVDGVMVGRQAYKHPGFLINVDRDIFKENIKNLHTLNDIILKYARYIERTLTLGVPLKTMAKPVLNLYQAAPGAKLWRRYLSENIHRQDAGVEVIYQALEQVNRRYA